MPEYQFLNGVGYRAPDWQREYRPPLAPEPFTPPRVTAPAASAEGTTLERAHAAIAHANKAFQKHLEDTNSNRHLYSDDGYRDQIAKFADTAAAKSVDAAVQQVLARRDQAAADIDKFRRNLTQPGDAAQESRNSRYWSRTKPLLDKADQGGGALALAEDLLSKASREEVSVLVEELGPYFDARGFKLERVNRNTGETTNLLDDTIARIYPEYNTARARLKKAKAAAALVERSAQSVRQGFAEGRAASAAVLQGFNPAGGQYDPDI